MPAPLALLITVGLIVYLFRRDNRERANVTGALWIPLLWMLIIGSRFVTEWFRMGEGGTAADLEEGSPVDRLVFLGLILAGLFVLKRRQVRLAQILRGNGWVAAYLLYCLLAILWSDFPFVAFKRWIKVLGHPIMVLVVFTEPDPQAAVVRLMKRFAYVVVPVSILFIKYFPNLGRGFDSWSGAPINTGITTNKNLLGCTCLVPGLFFTWQILKTLQDGKRGPARRNELLLSGGFLLLTGWLLSLADSKTSLMCLLVGVAGIVVVGLPWVSKRHIAIYVVAAIIAGAAVQEVFGVYERVLRLLGRNPTLTDRTEVWKDVLAVEINPILGAGFESFWLGPRLTVLWEKWQWRPNQAHNGYIETYVNLGLIGLAMLTGMIVATFLKIRLELVNNFRWGQFRFGCLLAVLLYNYTEAAFKALHLICFVFYILALDYRKPKPRRKRVLNADPETSWMKDTLDPSAARSPSC